MRRDFYFLIISFVLPVIIFPLLFSACTWRYSRELLAVGPQGGERVKVRSFGLEILFIAIFEPKTGTAMIDEVKAKWNCAAIHNIEIDYRSLIFIVANLPMMTVSADCEPVPPVPEAPLEEFEEPTAPAPSEPESAPETESPDSPVTDPDS